MPVPPNRPFYPQGNPNENDGSRGGFGRSSGSSSGSSRAGSGGGRGAPRGRTSREGSWNRTQGEPRARPAAHRLAGFRADLERALRELEEASKVAATAKHPPTSVLEHTQGPALDAIFAPWRRVRAALADVERACVAIERLKNPPKAFAPGEFRPRL